MARTVTTTLLSATGVAGERTNTTPFQQCSVVTDPIARGGYVRMYTAFYDRLPDVTSRLRLHCFRRSADAVAPYTWELESTYLTSAGLNETNASGDGHNSISLGVDENGILHAAWQAHHNEYIWCYWEGDAIGDIEIDDNTIPAGMPALCSYPKFTNNADGTLNFWARQGVAGNGEQRLHEKVNGAWTEISAAVIDWTGAGARSPYMHHIATNASGEHLVVWIWADDNYTAAYLGLKGFKCRRVSPGVWSFYDFDGDTFTLPANDDARFTIWDVPINRGTPVHHGAALKDDGSPIVTLMNAGDAPNTSTNRYRFTRPHGAWVRQLVQEVHPTWNLIDANGSHNNPAGANSEYQQASQVDVRWRAGAEHWIYRTNYAGLNGSGIPQIQSITTLDDGLNWSAPEVLVELPAGDMQPTCDDAGWLHFGECSFLNTLIDVAGQYVGGSNSNVHLVNVDFGDLTMGTLSVHRRSAMANHVLGVAVDTPAATHYLAAFVAGVEVSVGAYARKAVTNNTTNWPACTPGSRTKTLAVTHAFVTASGAAWGVVDEIRLFDASSGGNEVGRHTLASAQTIGDGDTLQVEAGNFDVVAPAGCYSDDLAEAILDHVLGSIDLTPETDVQFAYFNGDPQGAGAEITGTSYARITHDNDTVTWSTATTAISQNKITFAFPTAGAGGWSAATHWALFDAAGTGLMISAALPASRTIAAGETEQIAANRIRIALT